MRVGTLTSDQVRAVYRPQRRWHPLRAICNLSLLLATVGVVLILAWVVLTWVG
jgi:hypothetical protein